MISLIFILTLSGILNLKVNSLSEELCGKKLCPYHVAPEEYTGELYGVAYLYNQAGKVLDSSDIDNDIDEGFEDFEEDTSVADMQEMVTPSDELALPKLPQTASDSESVVSLILDLLNMCVNKRVLLL